MTVVVVVYGGQIHVYGPSDPAAPSKYETAYMSGHDPNMYEVDERLTAVLSGDIPGYTVTDHR